MIESFNQNLKFDKSPTAQDVVAQKERIHAATEKIDPEIDSFAVEDVMRTFGAYLQKKYSEYPNDPKYTPRHKVVVALAELVGSGGYSDYPAREEDFEGDDSVKKFLNEFEQEISQCTDAKQLNDVIQKRQAELNARIEKLQS